jgi:hypothetical protein
MSLAVRQVKLPTYVALAIMASSAAAETKGWHIDRAGLFNVFNLTFDSAILERVSMMLKPLPRRLGD